MTDLATLATLPLADRYAILKADIDALTKELDKAKAVKELLTPEQVASCSKTALITTLRVKPKTATVLA